MVQQTNRNQVKVSCGYRIFMFFFFWGGVVLLFMSVISAIRLGRLLLGGQETIGKVVDQKIIKMTTTERRNGRDYRVEYDRYEAIISFTVDGDSFTIESSNAGRDEPLYVNGSQLPVVYYPSHPEKGRLKKEISGFRGIFEPLMLLVFGFIFVGVNRLFKFIESKTQ